jgi:hypothetical protein
MKSNQAVSTMGTINNKRPMKLRRLRAGSGKMQRAKLSIGNLEDLEEVDPVDVVVEDSAVMVDQLLEKLLEGLGGGHPTGNR